MAENKEDLVRNAFIAWCTEEDYEPTDRALEAAFRAGWKAAENADLWGDE